MTRETDHISPPQVLPEADCEGCGKRAVLAEVSGYYLCPECEADEDDLEGDA